MERMTEQDFLAAIEAARSNLEGQRNLVDHLKHLAGPIAELRSDGVSWNWIASRIARSRRMENAVRASGRIRSAWSALHGVPPRPDVRPKVDIASPSGGPSNELGKNSRNTAEIHQRANRLEQQ